MDATRLLEKDHAAVRKLSKQYEKAGDRAFSTKRKESLLAVESD